MQAGVWQTDAPNGYVGIVVNDAVGMLMRLEIREAAYTPAMVEPLEEWLRQHTRPRLLPPR